MFITIYIDLIILDADFDEDSDSDLKLEIGAHLQSFHTILNQLLLVAYIQATTAEPDGSHGSPVASRTGGGFLVSLVARGSGPDLPRGSTRRQNGGVWRPLDPPIALFNSTRAERRCP